MTEHRRGGPDGSTHHAASGAGGGGPAAGRFTTKRPEAGSRQMKGCRGGRAVRQEAGAQRRAAKSVRRVQKCVTAEREAVM